MFEIIAEIIQERFDSLTDEERELLENTTVFMK